jgi:hypothetical protein
MSGYNCWTKYGERGIMMEDNNEEENDDNSPKFPETTDTAMEDNEEEDGEERASDMPADDLGQVIIDAQIDYESEKGREKLEHILDDHKKNLYPNCEDSQKKLGSVTPRPPRGRACYPWQIGFLSRCDPAMIRSGRRRSWRDLARPSSTRLWPCIRSASGLTDNSVSMRLSRISRLAPQTNTSLFCALYPHSCAPRNNFPVGHPSSNRSRPSTLNPKFLLDELPEKKVYLVDMSILSTLLSPGQNVTHSPP